MSLNTLSGPDSRDLSGRYPAGKIRVSAWFCQTLSEVPACYLGITRGRVRPFYLPVLPLYGFTKLYTNPFLIIYLLPNFKLPVLVLFWGLEQKKTKFGFPQDKERQLYRSYLHVSQDPINRSGQRATAFSERIWTHYKANRPIGGEEGPARSLETEWGAVKRDCAKFAGMYKAVSNC
jgi:hypothetical protein